MIGAGLAGLSSGVALAEAGFRVKLLEQRPFLGGRASSYSLPDGEEIDNCQHVTLGCCTNLDDFYQRVGALGKIARYRRLIFIDSRGHRAVVDASPLPAPFHLAPSLAFYPSLSWPERRRIGEAMLSIARRGGRNNDGDAVGCSMLDWLRTHRQSEEAMSPEEIEKKVKEIICSQLEVSEEQLRPEASFIDDLKADSLAVVELVLAFEQEFKITIPEEDTEQIKTVKDATNYIKTHAK